MGIFGSKKEIGPDTVLQRKQDILFNEIDGEVVMLSIENGEYYGMDKVGSRIWKILSDEITFRKLIAILVTEYNVVEKKCIVDTISFIKKLEEKKLIYFQDGASK
jgi:hypothetical protein